MFGFSSDKKSDGGGTTVEPAYPATDVEKSSSPASYDPNELNERGEIEGGVKRQLKPRHMAMIAIGGSIGTGSYNKNDKGSWGLRLTMLGSGPPARVGRVG